MCNGACLINYIKNSKRVILCVLPNLVGPATLPLNRIPSYLVVCE